MEKLQDRTCDTIAKCYQEFKVFNMARKVREIKKTMIIMALYEQQPRITEKSPFFLPFR